MGGAVGTAVGGLAGGAVGSAVGSAVGEQWGTNAGSSIGQALLPGLPSLPKLPATPQPPPRPPASEVVGPLYLPGLPYPVTEEEYNDPGALEVSIDGVTCTTLMADAFASDEYPHGVTEEMRRILELDEPLKVAFLGCFDPDEEWCGDNFLTDVKTGLTFKLEHLASGELTKAEEEQFWQEVRAAKLRELRSWHDNGAFSVTLRSEMKAG